MNTEDLVALLATQAEPVDQGMAKRRFAVSLLAAALGSLLLMKGLFGLRPDLSSAAQTALFWAKFALPACISIGALVVTQRLSRPGVVAGKAWLGIGAPVVLVWIAGAILVGTAAPEDRSLLILGISWRSCPFNILLLSIPGFAAVFLAVKGLAPTNLRLAGAAAGLLASSVATMAYCFHCPEMSPAFWSIWYILGMGLVAAVGAVAGPKLLRW
ncbi:DUF1109 domain-containing protein [Paraburkholderia silvatlantica]|uniref:DUF1109 domain-containing protein n=1 Tax=Paraburkholderia silvatlantica TaxID=321895 RepID=UPI0037511E02